MKEADEARTLWTRLRADLGKEAEDLSCMHPHHMHRHGPTFIDVLEGRGRRYGTVLEIGTAHGMGAVMLSCFADKVITIDVKRWPMLEVVIRAIGPERAMRIYPLVVADNAAKAATVAALDFEMAFIDGLHFAEEFKIDFDLCKRCGLLLCHDYPTWKPGHEGPGVILDAQTEGVLTATAPFAWWEAKP